MSDTRETPVIFSDILQSFLRAQKAVKMYPANNPIYGKAVDEVFRSLNSYLGGHENLKLRFTAHEIQIDTNVVYRNASRQDNFALFFFRDGVRELTFKPGIALTEVQDFLALTARDFERNVIDDDLVTMLWEKDFEHIAYLATAEFLLEEDYDSKLEKPTGPTQPQDAGARLQQVYEEAQDGRETLFENREILILSEQDLTHLEDLKAKEETYSPLPTVVDILFDIFEHTRMPDEIDQTGRFLREALEQSLRQADFENALKILDRSQTLISSGKLPATHLTYARKIPEATGHSDAIREMGELLDSGVTVNEDALRACGELFPTSSVIPLISLLGSLQSMHARRLLIELLAVVGRKDLASLVKGLKDSRWFVVRNTLCILGRIADVKSVDTLGQCVVHTDARVRKEAFRTLGAIGGSRVLPHLKKGFADADPAVRISAVKAFRGQEDSDVALHLLLDEINDKRFSGKTFEEKKDFFQILAQWETPEVKEFLKKTLEQKSLFNRSKNEEMRACAAYGIGFLRSGQAFLGDLEKAAESGGDLLMNEVRNASKRIRIHG